LQNSDEITFKALWCNALNGFLKTGIKTTRPGVEIGLKMVEENIRKPCGSKIANFAIQNMLDKMQKLITTK